MIISKLNEWNLLLSQNIEKKNVIEVKRAKKQKLVDSSEGGLFLKFYLIISTVFFTLLILSSSSILVEGFRCFVRIFTSQKTYSRTRSKLTDFSEYVFF